MYRACLDLLFPPRCAGCGRRGAWFCTVCLTALRPIAAPLCARCGDPLPGGAAAHCRPCRTGGPFALDRARAAYPFDGAIRRAIHRFKYEGERARAASLGMFLPPLVAAFAEDMLSTKDGTAVASHIPAAPIVPVPLAADRRRARGFNQAEDLARVLAEATGGRLDPRLARVRATRPQVGLDREARLANVRDAFAWRGEALTGRRVLLVDDVMTTGATAEACAAALKAAGAGWVGLVTVARPVGREVEWRDTI